MTQLQFLAMLSLVDSTVQSDAWMSDFLIGLRCVAGGCTCGWPGAEGAWKLWDRVELGLRIPELRLRYLGLFVEAKHT